jgi:glycosyltransferase involved in cell wall biosynthesis
MTPISADRPALRSVRGRRSERALPGCIQIHMTGSEWFSSVPGGLNRYFTDLYRALGSRRDLDVSAAAFGEPLPGGRSWGPTGGSTLRRTRAAFFEHGQLGRRTVVDRHFCLYGRPAIDRRGRHPLVVHFHGPWAAESRATGASELVARAKYLIERARYLGADRYVVLSNRFRDLLVETYRVPEWRIRVIPPGVDLDRFRPPELAQPTGTVLCVRRLEQRMGIDVLLRSWPEVLVAHPSARLVIVGTGGAEPALRAQVASTGLGASVYFEGRADDARLAKLYEQANLTVVPSVALEGFGLIALESLATGRAPIVTDCGGLPDSVRGLDPSLIVPVGDAEALATRIVRGLDGQVPGPWRCRTHAELFSWHAAAVRHVAMYGELLP